jgi:hypothetical protein
MLRELLHGLYRNLSDFWFHLLNTALLSQYSLQVFLPYAVGFHLHPNLLHAARAEVEVYISKNVAAPKT